jgi:hypothetical protein
VDPACAKRYSRHQRTLAMHATAHVAQEIRSPIQYSRAFRPYNTAAINLTTDRLSDLHVAALHYLKYCGM